ncbi:hypothetical protein H8711_04885 [Clostridiaceae bacterium NSJ-31]|uniref:Uncharacterized protein n=1 Tax=Ligaoa zhengdingensis TaxID=2763658 RepID=A0A926DWW9_9FIRM|nr:hypothetical protein [Ligaoa zhengdingensis]MBC8546271.1 hypothetical protein [Ligaoa zhengdingensis]
MLPGWSARPLVDENFQQGGQQIAAGNQLKMGGTSVAEDAQRLQNRHPVVGFRLQLDGVLRPRR